MSGINILEEWQTVVIVLDKGCVFNLLLEPMMLSRNFYTLIQQQGNHVISQRAKVPFGVKTNALLELLQQDRNILLLQEWTFLISW